jgi:hypothetical protein
VVRGPVRSGLHFFRCENDVVVVVVVVFVVVVVADSGAFEPSSSWLIRHHVVHGLVTSENLTGFLDASDAICLNAKRLGDGITQAMWEAAKKMVKRSGTKAIVSSSKRPAAGGAVPAVSAAQLEAGLCGVATDFTSLFHGVISDDPASCSSPVGHDFVNFCGSSFLFFFVIHVVIEW